jgi:hypothetical protein
LPSFHGLNISHRSMSEVQVQTEVQVDNVATQVAATTQVTACQTAGSRTSNSGTQTVRIVPARSVS